MIAHWEDLELRAADGTGSQVSFERGSPTGMNMARVTSAMSAIENCAVGRPPIGAALENIKAIAHRTTGSNLVVYGRCSRGCCCDGGDLRSAPPESSGAHHGQRSSRSGSASHAGAVQREHSSAAVFVQLCSPA